MKALRFPMSLPLRRLVCLAGALALAACAARTGAPPIERSGGESCLAELGRLGVQYQVAPIAASASSSCRVENPVRVTAATIPWNRPAIANCPFVVEFDRFEREVARPLAQRYFGQNLKAIIDFGAYSCRSTRAGRESAHATGMALDLAGFELADGAKIMVAQDWNRRGKARDFLRAVAGQACQYFNVVLTPDSDADHLNHIHLDLGPYKLCVRR